MTSIYSHIFSFHCIYFLLGCKLNLLCDSGEKKKHRKELIAKKRQQRMLSRGVDLGQINTVSHYALLELNLVKICFSKCRKVVIIALLNIKILI
jgi:hypothetical protein